MADNLGQRLMRDEAPSFTDADAASVTILFGPIRFLGFQCSTQLLFYGRRKFIHVMY